MGLFWTSDDPDKAKRDERVKNYQEWVKRWNDEKLTPKPKSPWTEKDREWAKQHQIKLD